MKTFGRFGDQTARSGNRAPASSNENRPANHPAPKTERQTRSLPKARPLFGRSHSALRTSNPE